MFKVNNKATKTTRGFGSFIVNFEHILHLCSSLFIVNFEQVNAGWELAFIQFLCGDLLKL